MSRGRAILIEAIARYTPVAMGGPSLIEAQKLLYFVEAAGEELQLGFVAHHYGPYSDRLRHLLAQIEGHYVTGFGDGSASVQHAEPLVLTPGSRAAAQELLAEHPDTLARIDRVFTLAEGFESAYGMELLSTVHWVATHSDSRDDDALVDEVRAWSPRKGRMFTPDHVRVALATLRERGWAPKYACA
jgi:O-acetyl-ADP-ribose deacetylase (regulator of RNase III)